MFRENSYRYFFFIFLKIFYVQGVPQKMLFGIFSSHQTFFVVISRDHLPRKLLILMLVVEHTFSSTLLDLQPNIRHLQ